MRFHRVHIAVFALLAVLLAAGIGAALFALPLLAIFALAATGRYVGEERILALRARLSLRVPRARARRWGAMRPAPMRSFFERAPRTFRGPPVFTAIV
jgi:hypothetical protein